ncbi:hypothetical protein BOTCAL_0780g00040 [Botryotinia calthae]|uniref:O-methyltransferase domain-containing protein n=1 Tax=Botryotinia calthae TaxID=38488 RepID=A0A4Y8CH03_9HELO|nr:hypothetical protein BOTCAL_0780g00040 [Botryotinia calthae]
MTVERQLREIMSLGLVLGVSLEKYLAVPATNSMTSSMIPATRQHFWDQVFEGMRQPGGAVLVDLGSVMGHDAVAFKHRMNMERVGGVKVVEDLPTVLDDVGLVYSLGCNQ